MPVLALVVKYSDCDSEGKIRLTLHNNVKAQNAVIRKISIAKSAASAATEHRIDIAQPELLHECFSTAKHGTFPVPMSPSATFQESSYGSGLSVGINNLPNILVFKLFNTDGTLVTSDTATNKSNFEEITIYLDYQTNDLF